MSFNSEPTGNIVEAYRLLLLGKLTLQDWKGEVESSKRIETLHNMMVGRSYLQPAKRSRPFLNNCISAYCSLCGEWQDS